MKKLVLIRNCQAEGRHRDSPLTNHGVNQAHGLAEYFEQHHYQIDRIFSSPYMRSLETVRPYARKAGIKIEVDHRLTERVLSAEPVEDRLEAIDISFEDMDYALPGGESSNDALSRVLELIEEIKQCDSETVALVTHGNLLMIILTHFDNNYGFKQWRLLKKPDVFVIEHDQDFHQLQHIW